MPEVSVTHGTNHLGADHAQSVVHLGQDIFGLGRIIERGPTAAGVELFLGTEEKRITTGTVVATLSLLLELLVELTVWCLGACLA